MPYVGERGKYLCFAQKHTNEIKYFEILKATLAFYIVAQSISKIELVRHGKYNSLMPKLHLTLWFGFRKKSIIVTIVSACIIVSVLCQLIAMTLFARLTMLSKPMIKSYDINISASVSDTSIRGIAANRYKKQNITIIKTLLGLLKPTTGEVTVLGFNPVKNNLEVLRHTGSLVETPIFYEHLSAASNLQIHLEYMGMDNTNIEDVLNMVGLVNAGAQPVSSFSLGMRQRLGIWFQTVSF